MLRQLICYIAILCSIALQAAVYTPAFVPNPKAQGQAYYVSNPDAIVADSDVVWLNECARRLEKETHVEMCIVALESIGNKDAFDFAYELFQRWGIGREGQNTGVLVLFVLQSRDIRIMTGVGLEGVLTDAECSKIVHNEMAYAFRAGDYGGGLCLGALSIYEACTKGDVPEELLAMRSVTNRGKYKQKEQEDTEAIIPYMIMMGIITFLIIIIIGIYRYKRGDFNHGSGSKTGGAGGPIYMGGFGGFGGGSSSGGSGGGFGGGSWGGGSTFGGGAGGKC